MTFNTKPKLHYQKTNQVQAFPVIFMTCLSPDSSRRRRLASKEASDLYSRVPAEIILKKQQI